MENKVIELNEVEQRNLFCAAWHFTNLIEDHKEDRKGDMAQPCITCKYVKECYKDGGCNPYEKFEIVTKLTGVIITPLDKARKDGFSLLLSEEDYQRLYNHKKAETTSSYLDINGSAPLSFLISELAQTEFMMQELNYKKQEIMKELVNREREGKIKGAKL